MPDHEDFDLKCINTIPTLSIDAVQAANSGHPGTPMTIIERALVSVADGSRWTRI